MTFRAPQTYNTSVTSTGHAHNFPALTQEVRIYTDQPLKAYWTLADFTAGTNGTVVTSTRPFQMRVGARTVWLKADAATAAVEIVSTH